MVKKFFKGPVLPDKPSPLTCRVRACKLATMGGKAAKSKRGQANVLMLAASRSLLLLVMLWCFSGRARGENISLQIRLEKALENARALTNVEIQFDDWLWVKGMPGALPPLTNDYTRMMHVTYIAAGGKYRIECRMESAQNKNIVHFIETAFDGKLWSQFDGGAWMVEQEGDQPRDGASPYNPLTDPFIFLAGENGLRFVDLRDPEILRGLILPEGVSSNGMVDLSFAGLPRGAAKQVWSMTIDDDKADFRPRKISLFSYSGDRSNMDFESTCLLSDYTNAGAYHFPSRIAYSDLRLPTNNLLPPTLTLTGLVTLVSFKILERMPEATFRLDESKAPKIWNRGAFKGYGVGLILGEAGSNIVVRRIVADSPAGGQTRLQAGDRILSVAESNAPAVPVRAGKAELPQAMELLRGAKGTAVTLAFIPAGKDKGQTQIVTLVRGEVKERLGDGQMLTNGMKAPDIEMVALSQPAREHLSNYAGKIVVLEFWASWCTPCQTSMADLQLALVRYPHWKDKVVLIAASVDDTAEIAERRIRARGWNQTHNVWLATKDLRCYHVGGIPYAYVIDAKGNIVASGVAQAGYLNVPEIVNRELDADEKKLQRD